MWPTASFPAITGRFLKIEKVKSTKKQQPHCVLQELVFREDTGYVFVWWPELQMNTDVVACLLIEYIGICLLKDLLYVIHQFNNCLKPKHTGSLLVLTVLQVRLCLIC